MLYLEILCHALGFEVQYFWCQFNRIEEYDVPQFFMSGVLFVEISRDFLIRPSKIKISGTLKVFAQLCTAKKVALIVGQSFDVFLDYANE